MRCNHCMKELKTEAKFCPYCGKNPLESPTSAVFTADAQADMPPFPPLLQEDEDSQADAHHRFFVIELTLLILAFVLLAAIISLLLFHHFQADGGSESILSALSVCFSGDFVKTV